MAIEVLAKIWSVPWDPATKLVLLKLADCAKSDGTEARPSVGRIAYETGLGKRTIYRKLGELQAAGVVVLVEEANRARHTPAVYAINMAALHQRSRPYAPQRGLGPTATVTPGDDIGPDPVEPVDSAAVAASRVPERHNPGATVAPNPSRTRPSDPSEGRALSRKVAGTLSLNRNQQPYNAEQKKAAWQSKICAWAQHRLTEQDYTTFMVAWANEEPWAKAKAEQFNVEMRAAA